MDKISITNLEDNPSYQLPKNQVVSLDMQAVQIQCVQGTLWVTWPDGNERVLKQGQSMAATSKGVICMQAFSDCAVIVRPIKMGRPFSMPNQSAFQVPSSARA